MLSAVLLLIAAFGMTAAAAHISVTLGRVFAEAAGWMAISDMDIPTATRVLRRIAWDGAIAMAPPAVTLFLGVIVAGLAQTRGLFTTKTLHFRFSRLNPVGGVQKFFQPQQLVELPKQLLKLLLVVTITYLTFRGAGERLASLLGADLPWIARTMLELPQRLLRFTALAFVVLAAADYAFQRFEYERGLKMSKQEIKEEQRQSEGDPHIKGRIRGAMYAAARRRMLASVQKADVVITNPTRRAIALRYRPETDLAPVVLAMGERKLAQRIRAIAEEHHIPLYEDRPLAEALIKTAKVGEPVPVALWDAVATVITYVYKQRGYQQPRRPI